MKSIQLTQDKIAIIDDADFDAVSQFKWYANKQRRRFYAVRAIRNPDGKQAKIYLHRFLMPGVEEIDHVDGDGLNNQRANLRPASRRQNMQASRRKAEGTSSSFRGVSWNKACQKWVAQTKLDGKNIHLGLFVSEREAAEAYDASAKQLFGEFASPNFAT